MRRVLSAKQKFEIWGRGHSREVPALEPDIVVVIPRVGATEECVGCDEPEAAEKAPVAREKPKARAPKAKAAAPSSEKDASK